MEKIEYDMDTSGGIMEQIQAIIAPPHSAEERKRLLKEKEQKGQRRHGNRNGGRNGGKTINRDCCDSCHEGGDLLCCDRCPASFHFQCCDPPLEEDDIPTGEWICNECKAVLRLEKQQKQDGQREETKSPDSPVSLPVIVKPELAFPQLTKWFKGKNPKEFTLPLELQDFTVFPGDRKIRSSKTGENGKKRDEYEENMDRLCFACSRLADAQSMAACDFCPLIFHIDCLHPPMVSPPTTMWMCPNHPENYETSLKDPRYCVRMDLTDDLRKNINQNTIVTNFVRRAKRARILSNREKKIQRRMIVPNAIKQEYKNPTVLQLPSYIQRMMEPLPPYARPLSLPSKSDQDEWLKSLVSLQCDIANEVTKSSVAQKEPRASNIVKTEPVVATADIKTGAQSKTSEDAELSLEANEKMELDEDFVDDGHKAPRKDDESGSASTGNVTKTPDEKKVKQRSESPLLSSSLQQHSAISVAKKSSVPTSSPKIIILATQSPLGGGKSSSANSETGGTVVSTNETYGSGAGSKSVIIKGSSQSVVTPSSSGSSHFVSSITSESLQDPLLSQLDQRLVKVLAFQRLQQLLGQTKTPQTVNKKITASNIQEILASNKPRGHAIAALCSLSAGPTFSMIHRSISIGQGADNDVTLPVYGYCNFISSKHACIFFDEETRQFELLNYSEHGTIVDNVLYSCDFSDKPNRNVTSSSARTNNPSKPLEKGKKATPHQTTKGLGIGTIFTPCGCRASGSSLIGGSGAGWEGTAVLHHGSFIKFGCLHFVFSIVENATTTKNSEIKLSSKG